MLTSFPESVFDKHNSSKRIRSPRIRGLERRPKPWPNKLVKDLSLVDYGHHRPVIVSNNKHWHVYKRKIANLDLRVAGALRFELAGIKHTNPGMTPSLKYPEQNQTEHQEHTHTRTRTQERPEGTGTNSQTEQSTRSDRLGHDPSPSRGRKNTAQTTRNENEHTHTHTHTQETIKMLKCPPLGETLTPIGRRRVTSTPGATSSVAHADAPGPRATAATEACRGRCPVAWACALV